MIVATGTLCVVVCIGIGRFALGMLLPSMAAAPNLSYSQVAGGSRQKLARFAYAGRSAKVVRNPKDELKTGTYHAMLKQLGLTEHDLY